VVADITHAQLAQLDISPQQRVPVSLNAARLRVFAGEEKQHD
jgi:iron(III) transport system ATP-binding protein